MNALISSVMNSRRLFISLSAAAALFTASVPAVAQTVETPPASTPAVPAPEPVPVLTEAQMLEVFGWMTGMRAGVSKLALSEDEVAAVARGIALAARDEDPAVDLQVSGPAIAAFVQGRFEAQMAKERALEETRSTTYWEELKTKAGVQFLPSGLAYEIIRPGSDRKPAPTDTVVVNYTGALLNGNVFDSTEGRGPYETRLDEVIPGWTEGVQLIGEGGEIRLHIPPDLGYGDYGSGNIPPGATLVFDVVLLQVKKAEIETEAATSVTPSVTPAAP